VFSLFSSHVFFYIGSAVDDCGYPVYFFMTTVAEQDWMDRIVQLNCIVCRIEGNQSPAVVHHILKGGRRIDHFHTIPLCPAHHNSGLYNKRVISRHPWARAFRAKYGTEEELLAKVKELLG